VLLEKLPRRLEKRLAKLLPPYEQVVIKLKGAFKEALVCTNYRVLVLKTGFTTGHLLGAKVFQLPYRQITSAEVNTYLLSGYFELSSGGEQNWRPTDRQATQGENCIRLRSSDFNKFHQASAMILQRLAA
jgi:hypothetical protein